MKQMIGPKLIEACLLQATKALNKRYDAMVLAIDPFNPESSTFNLPMLTKAIHDNTWGEHWQLESQMPAHWKEERGNWNIEYKYHSAWIYDAKTFVPRNQHPRGDLDARFTDPTLMANLEAHYLAREEHKRVSAVVKDSVRTALQKHKTLNEALKESPVIEAYVPEQYLRVVNAPTPQQVRKALAKPLEEPDATSGVVDADELALLSAVVSLTK